MKEFYQPTVCHIDDLREKQEWISPDDDHPNQISHNAWADEILNFYREAYR